MDSRRHFLRGLARAAAGGGRPAEVPPTPVEPGKALDEAPSHDVTARAASRPTGPASRYGALDAAWGRDARAALGGSAVLVIGAGALGAPVLAYAAGAGIGRLGVLDDADVAVADLYAETVHYTPDVGVPKVHSAAVKLGFLNPGIVVEPYQVRLDAENAEGLMAGQDLVVDCSNDCVTQRLVAAMCARLGIALVAAGTRADGGWVISAPAGAHACRACAGFAVGEGAGASAGAVAGAVAGVIGSLQVREALMRLVAVGGNPPASTLRVDLGVPELRRGSLTRRPDCPDCGAR